MIEEDIINILIDLKEKTSACAQLGFGEMANSFNEALHCIEYLAEKQGMELDIYGENYENFKTIF